MHSHTPLRSVPGVCLLCLQVFARLAPAAGESLKSLARELHMAKADGFILQRDWLKMIDPKVSTCDVA